VIVRAFLRRVFINRFSEVRSGWKIALFLALLLAVSIGLETAMRALSIVHPVVESVVLTAAAVGVTWCMTRFVNRKPFAAVGLWIHSRMPRELGTGLLVGSLMMAGIFVVAVALGGVQLEWRGFSAGQSAAIIAVSLFGFGVAAAFEEVLFRGYVFQTLAQGITILPAMLVLSGLFALAHAANPSASLLSSVNVFLAGLWLSFAYVKTRSLWLPIGLHWAWNFCQTTVFGFPTSGIAFADRRLFDQVGTGSEWVTGGGFGPEGGVLATLALVIGTWYLLKSRRLIIPEGIVTLDSLEDVLPPRAEGPTV
jgi:uncharacterized protein